MEAFGMAALFGLILGFMFGVGCAAAVIYTVYMGGYKRAIEDSILESKSDRYLGVVDKVKKKLGRYSSK
jgi:hypothetical protein